MTEDAFGRPDWDSYFMALASMIAMRSIDPSTKLGCVIVTPEHRVLAIGYNGPPRGSHDELIPLTRPDKYAFMAHAESNAVDNYVGSIAGSTVYVTGHPCDKCLLRLIQNGVAKIIYANGAIVMCNDDNAKLCRKILSKVKKKFRPLLVEYNGDFMAVHEKSLSYHREKCPAPTKKKQVKRQTKKKR